MNMPIIYFVRNAHIRDSIARRFILYHKGKLTH